MIIIGDKETTKNIDEYICSNYNISKEILMENSIFNLFNLMDKSYNKYTILCGFGNNGGDGYVLARLLNSIGKTVKIFKISDKFTTEESKNNYIRCQKLGIDIIDDINIFKEVLNDTEIIIDAIFGVGLDRELPDNIVEIINLINSCYSGKVLSIDVPTGLNADNGEIYNGVIKANETFSIMSYKKGFLNYNSKEFTGNIIMVENIILNKEVLNEFSDTFLVEKEDIKKMIKVRKDNSNKTDYGKNYIIAGSLKYPGAAYLTSLASINSGAGYTFLLSDIKELSKIVLEIPELIFSKDFEELKNATSIAIGPGVEYSEKINNIFKKYKDTKNIILDAGALNKELELYNAHNCLITPHTGEFSRLADIELNVISKDPIKYIKDFSLNRNINILLKGKNTYITDGIKTYIINTGNPYMAIAGMGDVLTGIISSLKAQSYSIIDSAIIGSYIHGYIADKLQEINYIVTPQNLIKDIPKYMKEILK